MEWTDHEEALICELRDKKLPNAEIALHFKDRTRDAVDARIRHLIRQGRIKRLRSEGLGHVAWTARDEALLMKLRGREPPATIDEIHARMPHRTRRSISSHIQELIDAEAIDRGPRSPHSRRIWSTEEDQLLVDMLRANKTAEDIARALDRTVPSINGHIAHLVRKGELLPRDERSILR